MDFEKLVRYVESNKKEHFAKVVAENERKIAAKKGKKKPLVQTR
ncbi:hypothetical protein ACFW1J_26135 [Priestia aryabhattai]